MRTLLCMVALAAALGLAACGDDDDDGGESTAPARAQAERPASAHPVGDTALAHRCHLAPARYRAIPAGSVPDGLLPDGAQLATGDAEAAVAHIPLSVPAALKAREGNAEGLGYKIDFRENENFEAELFVSDGPERIEMRLEAARRC